jgi:membrane protease YdiL (CAAX protease family)
MIGIFCPPSWKRLKARISVFRLAIGLGILAFILYPNSINSSISSATGSKILEALIFTLFIGMNEELFSRGLIFGVLESYGVGIAVTISSIHFGLLHLINISKGGQSASYTLAQVCSASAFGFLACALMLFTRSIWIPILLHALTDFPSQFDTPVAHSHLVKGSADWIGTLLQSLPYLAIGALLFIFMNEKLQRRLHRIMIGLGRTERE